MEDELLELQVISQEEVDWSQIQEIQEEELPPGELQLKGSLVSGECLELVQELPGVVIQEVATVLGDQEGRGEV